MGPDRRDEQSHDDRRNAGHDVGHEAYDLCDPALAPVLVEIDGGEHAEGQPVASLIACRLETGRTHQIRVHFAALHHPCAGDLTYGADPVLAKRLQDIGTATVMPLGSPIGSNRGIQTREQIRIIIEQAGVPVVVDAGLGAPSHASEAMEMGADAVLVNTAIAVAMFRS